MDKLQKVALVIGGGSGQGAASARALAQDGYLVAVMSSSGKGEALGKELGGIGITGTNRSQADIAAAVAKVMQAWGRIDVLVNSAGHGPKGDILAMSDADWHEGTEAYFLHIVRALREVTPIMAAQGGGAIINISTAWAFEPSAMFPTSGFARAGLAAFTKIYTDQYGPQNIRMNNVLPGWIDSLPEKEGRAAAVPLGRYGRAEEIAKTVAFLASEGAGYITGQNIRVDGGITRAI